MSSTTVDAGRDAKGISISNVPSKGKVKSVSVNKHIIRLKSQTLVWYLKQTYPIQHIENVDTCVCVWSAKIWVMLGINFFVLRTYNIFTD